MLCNRSLTITVSSDDEEVTAFCPGEEYDVEVIGKPPRVITVCTILQLFGL